MSKNFELMQQTERKLGAAKLGVPEFHTRLPREQENGRTKNASFNLDKVGRDESLRLVQNIFLLQDDKSPRVVVFAGIDSGNGCTGICAHSAQILAARGVGSVCLVDANMRSPSLPGFFGVTNHYGLSDALCKQGSIRDFAKLTPSDNLWLLSGGSLTAESCSLFSSGAMEARMAELRKEFDFVLVDCPPLNTYADGMTVGQLADGLVLVLEAHSTRRETAARVIEQLRAAQIRILGAALNKRTFPMPDRLYRLF